MKYCKICNNGFETEENICPVCEGSLVDVLNSVDNEINEYEAAEIISTMMITGIL